MVASVLYLFRKDIKALKITDAYGVHRVVYSLFPRDNEQERRFLYCDISSEKAKKQILILSKKPPKAREYGSLKSKKISEDFLHGDFYGFRVRINPVMRKTGNPKPVPITGVENLLAWFYRRAPDFGFQVVDETLQVSDIGVQQINKGNHLITHGVAVFSGVLSVINRERFVGSFENGIGRAKGFGFGLLQIVPLAKDDRLN
ncbi:MAG: type I-E CRISPR-associated protein Cas6/Cse3/CasE [Spirochaetales bacterium]|nr:type I-E CRISPR-associated protein Cas6/Cse3/CasE [Spirochaetales bacterium]